MIQQREAEVQQVLGASRSRRAAARPGCGRRGSPCSSSLRAALRHQRRQLAGVVDVGVQRQVHAALARLLGQPLQRLRAPRPAGSAAECPSGPCVASRMSRMLGMSISALTNGSSCWMGRLAMSPPETTTSRTAASCAGSRESARGDPSAAVRTCACPPGRRRCRPGPCACSGRSTAGRWTSSSASTLVG